MADVKIDRLSENPGIESRVREQLRMCGKVSLSDREILRRMEHYKNRIERAKRLANPRGSYQYEDCLVMHETYRRIAEERGILKQEEV